MRIETIRRVSAIALLAWLCPGAAPLARAAATFPLAHYAELLDAHTRASDDLVQTHVDYPGLRRDARWKTLVREVAKTDPKTLSSRAERLAYWINVYNIFAIDLVVDHPSIESIKDIGSFWNPVWKLEAGALGGKAYTLDQIEHEILRPMGEPRAHAAIVCASVSCPPLTRAPFEASKLESQLDAAVARWLSNPHKGMRLDRAEHTLIVSRIFDWFASDFDKLGGVLAFVTPHLAADDAAWLRSHRDSVSLDYFSYDWGLNQ